MSPNVQQARRPISTLLLASDGSPAMEGVIAMTQALSDRDSAAVHVVTAVEPLPVMVPEVNLPIPPDLERTRRENLETHVREQVEQVVPSDRKWTVSITNGRPDSVIADAARDRHADLIVLGLGTHGIVDRWFGGETALRVLRVAQVPLFAVAPTHTTLPRRVLVAMDFSEHAERALADALSVMDDRAELTFAHAVSREFSMDVWPDWDRGYEETLTGSFAELRRHVAVPASMKAQDLVLHGDPTRELLQHAERMNADLIVAGSHGRGFIAGTLLGRVSTKLIRGAKCSVFVAPPVKAAT
jgi:nucleotide-binding universal stress UspA family protein